ncbi:MAG: hypothetical protein HWQ38_09690 [Nostoc sp. NMS7]|uniref:hypothetical protein n=1 Tax=Nostoc sp. NMS7 TaxID=2815391 RepID=UPI0025FF4158|nr:hypothetical protein [Nostoc sp. NMS7]MBN3946741.1 hypothetical protein [Nostoc sp. NMS7]
MIPVSVPKGSARQAINLKINGADVSATYLTDLKSGEAIALLTDKGNWYLVGEKADTQNISNKIIIEYRKTGLNSLRAFKSAFLLINNESPQKTIDVFTPNSRHLTFSLGRYWTNIRVKFIQYGTAGAPVAGDINSSFVINYPGGSYQGEFNGLFYSDSPLRIDGFYQTPIINCADIDSANKVLDITWNTSFTDPGSNINDIGSLGYAATVILLRFLMPVIVTNGIKKTTISTFETEYLYTVGSGVGIQLAGGGCSAINFLLDNKSQIYMSLHQNPIGAKIFTYSSSANFPLIDASIKTFTINKGLTVITVPSTFTGGKSFSFPADNELFLKKKTLLVSGPARIDHNYNPIPSPSKINRVKIPANQKIYDLSQACSNFGVVIF